MEKSVWIKQHDIFKQGTILEKNYDTYKIDIEGNIVEILHENVWKFMKIYENK